jgi:glycosyltransferase involved in cell wall biosynthesis
MNVYTELSKHFNIHLIGMGGLGDPFFKEVINPRLTMYFVPNSHDYFDYQTVEEKKAKGHLHDILLTTKFELLPHLVQITQALADKSDIFISSHPYFVPLFEKYLKNKFIIYEAHNLDYNLKKTYFDDPGANEHIQYYLELVKSVEARACLISSLIFTVSEEEKKEISAFYKVQDRKMVVVPNCIDVYAQKYEYKRTATGDKKKLIFVGSAHGPNIEAVEYIVNHLASKTPQYTYIIIGNLINIYKDKIYPANVEFTGIISEKEKDNIFRTSDLAINPMFSGSGTNLKVLDYLATGIPLLSTSFGMRGLESLLPGIFLAEKENFIEQIDRIFSLDETFLSETTKKARLLVESNFDRSIAVKNLVKILEKKKFR